MATFGSRVGQVRAHVADPLYRTGYLLMASTLVSALLGFGFWTIAARLYSAREVGISSAAIAAMTFVSGICQLGLGSVFTRYVPTAGRSTKSLVLGGYSAAIAASLVLGAAAALSSPLWSKSLAFIGHNPGWSFAFIAAVVGWTIFSLQDNVLTGLRSTHIVPVESTAYAVIKLSLLVAISGLAVVVGPFIAWNAPTPFGVAIINVILFRRALPRHRRRQQESGMVDRPLDMRRVLQAVSANLTGSIFLQVAWFLTPVIVTDLVGATKEAYFYAPWTVLVALNTLTTNTMTALTVEGALDERQLFHLARRSLLNTWALLTPAVLIIVVAAPLILKIYGPAYSHYGSALMRLLALSLFPSAVTSIAQGVARVMHRNGWLIFIQSVPSLVQVGLTVWLVHGGDIAGAGWAQLLADGFGAVVMFATLLSPLVLRPPKPPPVPVVGEPSVRRGTVSPQERRDRR